MTDILVNVPEPQSYEAGSSWLCRLALSQGISLKELLAFLQFDRSDRAHFDRVLLGKRLARLRELCKLPEDALVIHERVCRSVEMVDPTRITEILLSFEGKPTFRYCPQCFREMRIPYIPIHWRFMAWRWCPVHDCLMEETCQFCGKRQRCPVDLATTVGGKDGLPWFNRCQYCGRLLSEASSICARKIRGAERYLLEQGRAFLASLFCGYYRHTGDGTVRTLRVADPDFSLQPFTQELKLLSPTWRRKWMIGAREELTDPDSSRCLNEE